MAIAGDLSFNPEQDALVGADGREVRLESPYGDELPANGFDPGVSCCLGRVAVCFVLFCSAGRSRPRGLFCRAPFCPAPPAIPRSCPTISSARPKITPTTTHIHHESIIKQKQNAPTHQVETYQRPPAEMSARRAATVNVDPSSQRLQLLDPFKAWSGGDLDGCAVLIKAQGKCTTGEEERGGGGGGGGGGGARGPFVPSVCPGGGGGGALEGPFVLSLPCAPPRLVCVFVPRAAAAVVS